MPARIYDDLVDWYTLLTPPGDYAEEAAWYQARILEHARREVNTVLELGAGVGANATFLRERFAMELVDLSEPMLRHCRQLAPGVPTHVGDMRTVRLGRTFDAVFVHDAASYMLTADDVHALARTVAIHLAPGGVALLCPDDLRENFEPGTEDGGSDGPDGRGVRYLAWSHAGPDDTVITDYAIMLREADGSVRVEHDRDVTGALPGAVWRQALREAGLSAERIALEHSEVADDTHHVFVAIKPV